MPRKGVRMTKDGTTLAVDSTQLISSLFALIPVPVAVADDRGRIVIANSSFTEIFQGIESVSTMPQRELTIPGHGTFEVQTLPLNEQGFRIIYATDVTSKSQLGLQVAHLEKMAAIGRVVTGVAHELNNPLADIMSFAPMMEHCNLDPTARSIVDVVFARAERAGHLVQNLLILAGITAPQHVPFDLNQTVRNVTDQRVVRNPGQQFDVTLELDPGLPRTIGDPSQIEQVVTALLVHAEEAIEGIQHRPGSIQIRSGVRAGRIQLHVTDNGHARDTARVFAPNPTGVGLNICAEIAKDHGGELYAWSAYGNGSTFTLELPIFMQDTAASSGSVNLGRCLQNKSIMVVDDEVHISELIDDVLSRHGATVQICNSGSDAYERLRSKEFDLVICDQLMPGLSGQSLYRLMEAANPVMKQRFLFMTGDVITAQAQQFFTQAGVQYLRKPFRIQDMLEAVEGLFSRSQPQGF